MTFPRVSCLMVTKAGREVFAKRAIDNFLAQSYVHKQLVIVAGTPEAFSGLPKNVKLVRARNLSLGGLRQQSVIEADGDLIATWDDDDESAPMRLEQQIERLGSAFACALSRVTLVCSCGFTCSSAEREQWEPTLIARHAGLPAYRDLDRCEDAGLVEDIKATHEIVTLDAPDLYRYYFHGGNASNIEHWQHLFEKAGGHHDVWKCASDRGLVEVEADETFADLSKRIENATSAFALARLVGAVDRFRAHHAAEGPNAEERARLALNLAVAYARWGELPMAQVWALRALQGGPRADVFCLLGEIAETLDEHDQAERWYESACGTTPRGKEVTPPSQRFARYAELRQFVRPLRTVRHRQRIDDGHVLVVMTCAGRERLVHRTRESLGLGAYRWSGRQTTICDDRLDGQAKTMLRAFEYAAQHPFTALTLIEDDAVLAKNALDYIASTEIDEDLALISWFTMDNRPAAPFTPFLYVTNAAIYRPSNQCITFPAATVHAVLASKRLHAWPEKHGADIIFREIPGKPCAIHYPNLAQHAAGNASLTGNVGERISRTFLGEDVDALGLLDR